MICTYIKLGGGGGGRGRLRVRNVLTFNLEGGHLSFAVARGGGGGGVSRQT